jgi:NAD(P) transhydrogenase
MLMTRHYDLISIGSGPSGRRGAIQAAKLGKRVAIVEQGRMVGGVCLDTGTIPSKTFREAVINFLRARATGQKRTRAEARPQALELLRQVGDVVAREADTLEAQLHRNHVDLYHGRATFEDPHTLIVLESARSERLHASHVLIACGTAPAPPPGVETDGKIVITSDQACDLTSLPRTMAVVGGGVIGIEYASMFAALGVEVTLIDKRERPLEFLDREIVDELIYQMRSANVTFRLGEAVERIEVTRTEPRRAAITLESGKHIVTDLLLFSVGRLGATKDLNLAAAGLTADERGRLTVDPEFRTSVPHIYAAGDVIGYPALAATSAEQGRLAACYAFGVPNDGMADHFPIGIYSIPEISMAGATEQELTKARVPYEIGVARYREIARGSIVGDESGFFKMLFHRDSRRLLGVHIIGTGATELLHIGQAVLKLGGGLDYFLQTVFNYPTLAECYKVAALDAYNKLSVCTSVRASADARRRAS